MYYVDTIYDSEADRVTKVRTLALSSWTVHSVFNPFMKTLLVPRGDKLEVFDLNGNLMKTFNTPIKNQRMALVDEYRVCCTGDMKYFDLRTGGMQVMWQKDPVSNPNPYKL